MTFLVIHKGIITLIFFPRNNVLVLTRSVTANKSCHSGEVLNAN